jgi:hypothetical protein
MIHPQRVLGAGFTRYCRIKVMESRTSDRHNWWMPVITVNARRGVQALVHRDKLRTASAWKFSWPRIGVRSLKEPAFVAELQPCESSDLEDHARRTIFPGYSLERRHVFVSVALQLKQRRCMPLPSFILASSV